MIVIIVTSAGHIKVYFLFMESFCCFLAWKSVACLASFLTMMRVKTSRSSQTSPLFSIITAIFSYLSCFVAGCLLIEGYFTLLTFYWCFFCLFKRFRFLFNFQQGSRVINAFPQLQIKIALSSSYMLIRLICNLS